MNGSVQYARIKDERLYPFQIPSNRGLLNVTNRILTRLMTRINVHITITSSLSKLQNTSTSIINNSRRLTIVLQRSSRRFQRRQITRPTLHSTTMNALHVNRLTCRLQFHPNVQRRISRISCRRIRILLPTFIMILRGPINTLQVIRLIVTRTMSLTMSIRRHLCRQLLIRILTLLLIFVRPRLQGRLNGPIKRRATRSNIPNMLHNNERSTRVRVLICIRRLTSIDHRRLPLIMSRIICRSRRCLLPLIRGQRSPISRSVQTRRQTIIKEEYVPVLPNVLVLSNVPVPRLVCPIRVIFNSRFNRSSIDLLLLRNRRLNRLTINVTRFRFPFRRSSMCLRPITTNATIRRLRYGLLMILLMSTLHRLNRSVLLISILFRQRRSLTQISKLSRVINSFHPSDLIRSIFLFTLNARRGKDDKLSILSLLRNLRTTRSERRFVRRSRIRKLLST